MRRSPDVSPRRLSDISPQLRQLKYLVVDEAIKEDSKWSRSVEDLTSASVGLTSIEERILRITGYYGYQPWAASYKSKSLVYPFLLCRCSQPPSLSLPPNFLSAAGTSLLPSCLEGARKGLVCTLEINSFHAFLHVKLLPKKFCNIRIDITSAL